MCVAKEFELCVKEVNQPATPTFPFCIFQYYSKLIFVNYATISPSTRRLLLGRIPGLRGGGWMVELMHVSLSMEQSGLFFFLPFDFTLPKLSMPHAIQ